MTTLDRPIATRPTPLARRPAGPDAAPRQWSWPDRALAAILAVAVVAGAAYTLAQPTPHATPGSVRGFLDAASRAAAR